VRAEARALLELCAMQTIDLDTLTRVLGGKTPGDRDFDVNRDGSGRVIDHNNGQHVGGPGMNPAKTVDLVPAPADLASRN
jgi:hypothetical protein